jgi:hypothetical protein
MYEGSAEIFGRAISLKNLLPAIISAQKLPVAWQYWSLGAKTSSKNWLCGTEIMIEISQSSFQQKKSNIYRLFRHKSKKVHRVSEKSSTFLRAFHLLLSILFLILNLKFP